MINHVSKIGEKDFVDLIASWIGRAGGLRSSWWRRGQRVMQEFAKYCQRFFLKHSNFANFHQKCANVADEILGCRWKVVDWNIQTVLQIGYLQVGFCDKKKSN